MPWVKPQYSHKQVNAAGDVLIAPVAVGAALEQAYSVINNWRASHSGPLGTFQIGLRQKAKQIDPNALIAQRLKRLSSIELKLRRFSTMKLSQMQDIGGCRAIVRTVHQVDQLVSLYMKCRFKHRLVRTKDYIQAPASSGYRSVHLIFRYHNYNHPDHRGLQIEMQLRSRLQHAWATAVEIVGTFTQQALKSSFGKKEWLRFFALVGSAFALKEKTALVPNTPIKRDDLIAEIATLYKQLDVYNILRGYGTAVKWVKSPGLSRSDYFLLFLEPTITKITAHGYRHDELEEATQRYAALEREIREKHSTDQAVLVSVRSLRSLRTAYPNYFLDAGIFVNQVVAELRTK